MNESATVRPVGQIYAAVAGYFAATGMEVEEHVDEGWVATHGFGRNGEWTLVAQADEPAGLLTIYAVLPDAVPAERRAAIAELFARVNFALPYGAFLVDVDDGEMRFRTALDTGGGEPNEAALKPLVARNLMTVDRHLPALRAVLAGADPRAALVEHPGL